MADGPTRRAAPPKRGLSRSPFAENLGVCARECARAVRNAAELHARLVDERMRLTNAGYLPVVGQLLFRHGEIRLAAELRWHAELLGSLPLLSSAAAPPRA